MRVLFVTRSLQKAPGGMQTAARSFIHALGHVSGVQVTVFGWSGSKVLLPAFLAAAAVRALAFRGDCVHFGDAVFAPVIACVTFLRPRLRVTCTVHGLDIVYPHPLYRMLLRGIRCCDAVVAVSKATAAAAKNIGVAADRIRVIPWGVDVATRPHLRPAVPTLVSVGRHIRRKGTAWFLTSVFPRLLVSLPNLHYIVVGSGPETQVIQAIVERLGLHGNVSLVGAVPDAEREALLRQASVFMMPNIPVAGDMEGFGMACIEASALGVPVVASRLEGIVDAVIEEETGMLFTPLDAADAERTVRKALQRHWDPVEVQRSCSKHFALATVASRYVTDAFSAADHRHSHRG